MLVVLTTDAADQSSAFLVLSGFVAVMPLLVFFH